ncbi:hypothetical protein ACTA71_011809 [Dictyostelium dimigraforme]
MYKVIKFYFLLIAILLIFNISFSVSQNIITVNYNVPRDYNSFEECGLNDEPVCTSLEDAGNKAILLSKTSNPNNYINIIGDINGSTTTPVTFGNLYNYCGKLYIKSNNSNVNINIDGTSSTQQPFLTIKEADQPNSTYPCSIPRIFQFQYLNFTNWHQTIIDININHETDLNSIDPSKSLTLYFQLVNIFSSSSILKIYPKNLGQVNYNLQAIKVAFISTVGIDIKSSSVLFSPNSTQDYLPPIYISGASVSRILSLSNSTLESTPFIFSDNGGVTSGGASILNNIFNGPFIMAVNGGTLVLPILSFINNSLSTFIHFSNFYDQPLIQTTFSNNIFGTTCYQNCKFMDHQYENSIMVIKDSDFSSLDLLGYSILTQNTINNNLIFVGNSSLNLDNSIIRPSISTSQHLFNSINSSISIINFNLTSNDLPIVGSYSNINLFSSVFSNDVYCGCQGCSFYIQSVLVNPTEYSSQCNF